MKVAILQINPTEMNQESNLVKGLHACRIAKEKGADIILFPEMWNIGYAQCPRDEEQKAKWESSAISLSSNFIKSFKKIAAEIEIHIAITFLHDDGGVKPKNSVSLINSNGEIIGTHSKVFTCDWTDEDDIGADWNCESGKDFNVVESNILGEKLNIGFMICADREFPLSSISLLKKDADLILVPNSCDWNEFRDAQLRVRAFESMAATVMSNYPKPKNNGNSCAFYPEVFDERGNLVDSNIIKLGEEETIKIVDIDLQRVRDFRKREAWRLNKQR